MTVLKAMIFFLGLICLACGKTTITTTSGISSNDLGLYSFVKSSENQHSKSSSSPFNSFNQYTVDQLLVKVPSILEEPDDIANVESNVNESLVPSSSNDLLVNDLTTIATNNQNVFQNDTNSNSKLSSSSTSSPEHNLLAKSRNRYRSIKRLLSQITFNCSGRPEGYYSDTEFDCRIFHYCKKNGFKFTFICPGSAVFNQKELTCDSAGRNSERMCRSSASYYFLNSMFYSKDSVPQLIMSQKVRPQQHLTAASSLSPQVDTVSTEAINGEDSASDDALADTDTFGKWVTYISTGTVPLPTVVSNSLIKGKVARTKPKRNRVHFDESSALISTISSRKPNISAGKRKLERHSSELSVVHSSSSSTLLPDFLLTSPSPPIEQIDTPRWFPEKGNASTDFTEHLNSESVNKYSVDGESLNNAYIVTATVSTADTDRVKAPSEVNEVINAIDSPLQPSGPSKVLFPGQSVNQKPLQNRPQTQVHPSTKPLKHQPQQHNPFQVDWDDDDQLLVNEFHKQNGLVNNAIIKGPVNEETVNYLYGKPMEPLPAVQFSPVDFESLMEKLPQHPLHTMPIMSPSFMDLPYHQQQMMANFGQFAPSGQHLPPMNMAGKKKHAPKSQFKVLFGNLVRGGSGNKINRRRWSATGQGADSSSLPFIWPLMSMVDGGGNSYKRLENVRQQRPMQTQSPWNNYQSMNVRPVQVIELQRRTDRGLQFGAPSPSSNWKSSLASLLSRLTKNRNRPMF